jgi:hypothetical protein
MNSKCTVICKKIRENQRKIRGLVLFQEKFG